MTYDIISTRKFKKEINFQKPEDIVSFLKRYTKLEQEMFLVITLNGVNDVIRIHITTIGLINKTIINPREVFTRSLKDNSSSIIIVHNHPSGHSKPSKDDEEITQRMYDSSKILGITLLDHLIITKNDFYSFRQDQNILK
jgi:DNA repair protein RadC